MLAHVSLEPTLIILPQAPESWNNKYLSIRVFYFHFEGGEQKVSSLRPTTIHVLYVLSSGRL